MASLTDLREQFGPFYLALNPSYKWVKFQQLQIIPHLEAVERGEIERLAIFMPPGHLAENETLVSTPDGWREHGALLPGDFVFGVDGQPIEVIAHSQSDRADVRVTLTDSSEFYVHENHEWTVFDRTYSRWLTVPTSYFLKTTKFGRPRQLRSAERSIYQLPLSGAVQYPHRDLGLHPYALGAWIGDGYSASPAICYPVEKTPIIDKVRSLGYEQSTVWLNKNPGGIYTASFGGERNQPGRLRRELASYGLFNNKHIPEAFKLSSIEQRLELLAGLIDTDGSKDKERGRYRICTVRYNLAQDIAEIVRSLGWHPCIYEGHLYNTPDAKIISKQTPYYVGFSPSCAIPVAVQKKQLTEFALRRRNVALAEVERVGGNRRGKCIQVASQDGLYLVGKTFAATHNSKSDTATRSFIPWFLGRNPRKNAMVCSYSADLASDDFGANIKARMSSDLYKKIFPEAILTRDSRAKTHFTTKSGGSFYSVGFQGGITGKRLDLMVLDDLIKNKAEAMSDAVQQELFDTYRSTVKDRMRPQGKIVMCMHRWLINDIAGRILDMDGTTEEGGRWTVLKLPAEDPPNSGKFLWEEHYGRPYYLDFKKDDDTWASKFQQDPQSQSGYKFREEWLQFYENAPPPGRFKSYIICDPAASKSKSSDFTVISVFCAAQEEKLILADWVWDRLDPGERTDAILRLCRKWKPEGLYYETYGLNGDLYYLREAMKESNFPESAYPVAVGKSGPGHNNSKEARIDGLIPVYRRGRIVLPRKFERTRYDGTTIDYTERFIEKEYKLYRGKKSVPHEDNLDCQSRIADPMVRIDYDIPQENKHQSNRRATPAGASWYALY